MRLDILETGNAQYRKFGENSCEISKNYFEAFILNTIYKAEILVLCRLGMFWTDKQQIWFNMALGGT